VPTAAQSRSPLLTTVEVARIFGCSLDTVRRWNKSGRLPGIRVGQLLRFEPEDVDALIQNGQRRESP
jgi:excisionase family DNA binding protein